MTATAAGEPTGARTPGRTRIRVRTLRRDAWWAYPLVTFTLLAAYVVYATYAAPANRDYYTDPYLSPFYSPCLSTHCGAVPGSAGAPHLGWFGTWWIVTPAVIVLIFPLGSGWPAPTTARFTTAPGGCPRRCAALLENLLRNEDGHVTADQITALAGWNPTTEPATEIRFTPSRVLMQDLTGVPCVVDLVAMQKATAALGGDPARINPLRPVTIMADAPGGNTEFTARVRIDTPTEADYYRHGGILPYALRSLLPEGSPADHRGGQ